MAVLPWLGFAALSAAALSPSFSAAQTLEDTTVSELSKRVSMRPPKNAGYGPVVPPFKTPEAVFTDPWGSMSWLRKRGVTITMDNTNEFTYMANEPTKSVGHYRKGGSNAGQVNTAIHLNWEKLIGLKGFATHTIFTSRYGTTANRMAGDWLGHSSEIYGGGGNVVVHLVMMYGEETLLGGRLNLAAGRMTEMTDFSSSPLFCNFQNNSMCGRPKAVSSNQYIAAYPAAEWAFRMRSRPTHSTYFQAGVYGADQGIYAVQQHRSGFHWNYTNMVGLLFPMEVGWEPKFGAKHNLDGHYKIGGHLIVAPNPDTFYDVNGMPLAMTGKTAYNHNKTYTLWAEADQKLWLYPSSGKKGGTTLMTGFVYNNPKTDLRNFEAYLGTVNRGFIPGRPYDSWNFIVSYVRISPWVTRTDRIYLARGKASKLPNHATGVQKDAFILETNYQIHVMRGVVFAPDTELYIHPNGQHNLKNAIYVGFKAHVQFF